MSEASGQTLGEGDTQRERELMIIINIIKRPVWTEKVDFCKNQKHKLIRKKKESSEIQHKAKTGSPVFNLRLIILVVFFFFNVCSGLFFPVRPYTLHVVGLLSLVLVRVGSQLDENFRGGWVQHSGRQEGHVPWTLLQVQEMCQSPELLRHLDHFGSLGSLEFSMFPAVIEYVE